MAPSWGKYALLYAMVACIALKGLGVCALDTYIEDTDRFPGWKGELPTTADAEYRDSVGYGELGKVRQNLNGQRKHFFFIWNLCICSLP